MAFAEEVPAQREPVRFLAPAAALGIPLRVGGHSKGGNLAVYAAARCSGATQARVTCHEYGLCCIGPTASERTTW